MAKDTDVTAAVTDELRIEDITELRILEVVTDATANGARWLIDVEETYRGGQKNITQVIRPVETVMHRCAEYGFSPDDTETLLDILVLEVYLDPAFWSSGEFLMKAKTLAQARAAYLRELKKTKVKLKGGPGEEKLRALPAQFMIPDAAVAIRSLSVILERHRNNAQSLDPDVARALEILERAAHHQLKEA